MQGNLSGTAPRGWKWGGNRTAGGRRLRALGTRSERRQAAPRGKEVQKDNKHAANVNDPRFIALASPVLGVAQQATESAAPTYPKADLSKPFAPTLGDVIAQSLADLVTAAKRSTDPPTLVVYDRDAKKIAVLIYGSKTTLDEADFGYLYYHGGKNLISWEDGKYTVGDE